MIAATGGYLAPSLQNGRSLLGLDFGQGDRQRSAPLDERLPSRGANVSYPLRTVPKHRNEIAPTLVIGDDQYG